MDKHIQLHFVYVTGFIAFFFFLPERKENVKQKRKIWKIDFPLSIIVSQARLTDLSHL